MYIYSLKDVKSGFLSLLVLNNDELAKRSYRSILSDTGSVIGQHPEDFELWCLGEYDTDSGVIKSDVRFVASSTSIGG